MDSIFVKIASYRDAELPRTILSALSMAKFPERLSFGVCWQYDEVTYLDLDPFIDQPNFRVDQTYYENSLGCCWARNRCDLLYQGEKYMLQIDAHTRFAQDWDQRYIDMLERLDSEKPLLSTYPAPFTYVDGVEQCSLDKGMQRLVLSRISKELTTTFKTELVENNLKPVSSDFIAAGQIFTHGRFCVEVEYDPGLYFSGEEISLSARAFTHGYDCYCPNEDLIWHFYQHSMPVHSVDHRDNQHQPSMQRLHTLFVEEHEELGKYGFGKQRTLADFERRTGIDFKARTAREFVETDYKQLIELDLSRIEQRDDYDFWIFTLRNIDDKEIYRRDLQPNEIPKHDSPHIYVDERLIDEPISYGIWPHSKEQGFFTQQFRDL